MLVCELLREDAVARKDRHQNEKRIELEVYHIGGTVSDMERTQDAADSEEEDLDDDDDLETQLTRSEETDEYINFEVVRAEFDDLVDIIDRLYRLAAKLRSTTARNPPSARNFYRDPYLDSDGNDLVLEREEGAELRKKAKEQTERFHYRRIKEIIRQALKEDAGNSYLEEPDRVKFGPEEKELVRNESGNRRLETKIKLNPHAKSVVRRIAIGTAYRQQQFIFWRQREWERRNIAARQKMQETKEGFMRQASKPLAGAEVLNEIGNQGLGVPADCKVPLSEIPSQTWKMPHEKNLLSLNETRSQTSKTEQTVTPTVYEPGGRKVGWPAFPKELNGKKDFICPYCFVTCPPKYRGKGHWR